MLTEDNAANMRECFRLEDYEWKMVRMYLAIGAVHLAGRARLAAGRYRSAAIAWASK